MTIRKLDPIVANRIAAGEVVERPSSALRELLDNSIDSKATKITVHLLEGGIRSLTVTDNGCGMDEDDLLACTESHATSKIRTLDDLYSLSTMGFRGEALCSICAVSRLTIQSGGKSICVDNGTKGEIRISSVNEGTVVTMEDLFENIPARKQFLKRSSSEASDCRKVFIEKALGFENIEFLFFNEGVLELHFQACDRKKRSIDIMNLDKDFYSASSFEMSYESEPVSLYAVASTPSQYKRDRSSIRVMLNNRIIDSYQIVSAITKAYSVSLPGGAYPYFTLFITDSPTLVDFNIHPAKRECKIRNQSAVYGMITTMIRDALLSLQKKPLEIENPPQEKPLIEVENTYRPLFEKPVFESLKEKSAPLYEKRPDPSWFDNAKKVLERKSTVEVRQEKKRPERQYRYLGQAFDTFLVVETEDRILFIDQHAAHERILYDRIVANPDKQMLIVPYRFETDRSTDDFLSSNSVLYQDFGVELVKINDMEWEMTSIPAVCRKNESEIVDFIRNSPGDIDEARKGLFAIIACHSAIRSGDVVDDITAQSLLEQVFSLDAMLCPHGRSFVYEITRDRLFIEVGRTV